MPSGYVEKQPRFFPLLLLQFISEV